MKTNRKKSLGVAVFIMVIVFIFTACGDNADPSSPQTKTYTITFNADNGTENTTQTVVEGGKVTEPISTVKNYILVTGLYTGTSPTSYILDGWYNGETKWIFDVNKVTTDIILTARWIDPIINIDSENGNNIVEKAVSYVNSNGGDNYTLVLGEDINNVAPQTLEQNDTTLTITSSGNTERKITLDSIGWFFLIGGSPDYPEYVIEGEFFSSDPRSTKLVLDGNITLEGKTDNIMPLIAVTNGGVFHMRGYTKIFGNKSRYGAGVHVSYNGTFIMEGGNISNNIGHAVYINGADYLENQHSGTFIMEGGEISDNAGSGGQSGGGGVRCMYGNFIMKDGAKITRNIGYDSAGGVRSDLSTFVMEGGEISNNSNLTPVNSKGGGVEVALGTFNMLGGTIYGNVSIDSNIYSNYSCGAGVHIRNSNMTASMFCTFTKTGGTIYGYADGNDMSNINKDGNGLLKNGKGHAIYVNDTYFRDTTVGANDSLSIISYGGGAIESPTGQWSD